MTFFLTTLPLWLSAVILIVPTTLLAMAGPVIVRRYIDVNQLRTNNEVAGFKFATVGVLYAVLLAFAVVVVWEKFNQAESEVATFFFGAENLRAQSLMTSALSILIFAGLLTVVESDHPFAGTVKVGPEALAAVVKDFAGAPPQR